MRNQGTIYVCVLFLLILGIGSPVLACPPWPNITSPYSYQTVFYGADIDATCSGGEPPLTWSGDGSFWPSTGSSVTWTAPSSGSSATLTVTDALGRSDSVTVYLSNVIYVDIDRSAYGDGTSWNQAFKYIHNALDASGPGCEIWVAEGTYHPGMGTGRFVSYRTHTLYMQSSVALYGGFAGTEYARSQRNPDTHPTIIDGDIGQSGVKTDNTYRLVSFSWDWGAVLDGFTVQLAYADNNTPGAGIYISQCSPTIANCLIQNNESSGGVHADGAGMFCNHASPTVTECDFLGNKCGADGGAVMATNGSGGSFTDCSFSGNGSYDDGAAVAIECGSGSGSSPSFTDCTFTNNSSGEDGGAIHSKGSGSNPTFSGCTFTGNSATATSAPDYDGDGGAMAWKDGSAGSASNCTFSQNQAKDHGGAVFASRGDDDDGTVDLPSHPSFTNCTFGYNSAELNGGAIRVKESFLTISGGQIGYNTAKNNNGGGIHVDVGSQATISNVDIHYNSAGPGRTDGDGGGICIDDASYANVSGCTIHNNTATDQGGGVRIKGGSSWTNTNNTIYGNVPNDVE